MPQTFVSFDSIRQAMRRCPSLLAIALGVAASMASAAQGPQQDARDPNPGQMARIEAARKDRGLDRDSELENPERFDEKKFRENPDQYLKTHRPSRVWVSKPGGPGVPTLDALPLASAEVKPGGKLTLQVKGAVDAPVTFLSTGLGAFANGLTSQTVKSNAQGIASVVFTATPGTTGDVPIIAASPLASGQARFFLTVTE